MFWYSRFMAVQKSKYQKTVSAPTESTKKRVVWAVLAVVLIAVVGLLLYRNHQTNVKFAADKSKFSQTETSMQRTYDKFKQVAGEPAESAEEKNCGHTSVEFGSGPLFCQVIRSFYYGVDSEEEGQNIQVKLVGSLKDEGFSGSDSNFELGGNVQQKTATFTNGVGMECMLTYGTVSGETHNSNMATNASNDGFTDPTDKPYAVEFGLTCAGRPVRAVYPLKS